MLRIVGIVANAILVVAYPIAIWFGLTRLGTRAVSLMVLALAVPMLAIRFRKADRATFWSLVRAPIAMLVLATLGAVTGQQAFVLALPVLISAVLLAEFGATLRPGATPMIERFARMQEPDLGPREVAHCRRWTAIWCGFFVVNGAIAATLAIAGPLAWWTLYSGGLAYGLMGLLFASEWATRPRRTK